MKFRLKQRAVKLCMQAQADYAKCCSDKVLSVVWACRAELRAFSDCCHQQYVGGALPLSAVHYTPLSSHSTNPEILQRVKQRWLEAGSPSTPDWDALLYNVS